MNSMWKRSFALLLSLVMVFGIVPVNAFAEETETEHSHSYVDGVCTCGDVEHTHSYEAAVTAPTCTDAGYTTYTCGCGHSYTADEVAAAGHTYAEGVCACGAEEPAAEEETEEVTEEETTEEETEEEPAVCDGTENCPAETHESTCECYDWCAALGCTEEAHHADCPWGPCTLTEGCELVKNHPGECTGAGVFVADPNVKPNATVSVLPRMTLTAAEHNYMIWPRGGDQNADRPLDIVMKFEANDDLAAAQKSYYREWKTDFYLTFSGLTDNTLIPDGDTYLAGEYGSYGWIVVPANGIPADGILTEGLAADVAYPVVSILDPNLTYENICDYVQKFTAAIHISDALLEKHPNIQITLELKMVNPNDDSDVLVVGGYTYSAADLRDADAFEAKVGTAMCLTLESALNYAQNGSTVTLLKDVELSTVQAIDKAITLDLNSKTVTGSAKKVFEIYADSTIKNGNIVNTYKSNTADVGRCVDTRKAVALTLNGVTMNATGTGNTQPLTIGGNEDGVVLNVKDCSIDAGKIGYSIISFVETTATIENTDLYGYGNIHLKAGSDSSVFTVTGNSALSASKVSPAETFGAIIFDGTEGCTVTMDANTRITAMNKAILFSDFSGSVAGKNTVNLNGAVEAENVIMNFVLGDSTVTVLTSNTALISQLEEEGYYVSPSGMVSKLITTVDELNAAIAKGGEYKLGADITLTAPLAIEKSVTILDLNGKTLTGGITVGESGNLTITDSGENGTVTGTVTNSGILTITGGTFNANVSAYVAVGLQQDETTGRIGEIKPESTPPQAESEVVTTNKNDTEKAIIADITTNNNVIKNVETNIDAEANETAVKNATDDLITNAEKVVEDAKTAAGEGATVTATLTDVSTTVDIVITDVKATTEENKTEVTITYDVDPVVIGTLIVTTTKENTSPATVTNDIKQPLDSDDIKAPITFRLPVPSDVGTIKKGTTVYIKHTHGDNVTFYIKQVQEENGKLFIEMSSAEFSEFEVEFVDDNAPENVQVGEYTFEKLEQAYAYAKTSGETTIKLLGNVTLTETLKIEKTITLDLNGHTISAHDNASFNAIEIASGVTLTIKDSGTGGKISSISKKNLILVDGGALVLKSGTLECGYYGVRLYKNASFTMDGGKIVSRNNPYWGTYVHEGVLLDGDNTKFIMNDGEIHAVVNSCLSNKKTTTIIINGGSITEPDTTSSPSGAVVSGAKYSRLEINGGTITGVNVGVRVSGGNVSINRGTITAKEKAVHVARFTGLDDDTYNPNISVAINGGTLQGTHVLYEETTHKTDKQGNPIALGSVDNTALSVTGGTIKGNVSSENCSHFISGGTFSKEMDQDLIVLGHEQEGSKIVQAEQQNYAVAAPKAKVSQNVSLADADKTSVVSSSVNGDSKVIDSIDSAVKSENINTLVQGMNKVGATDIVRTMNITLTKVTADANNGAIKKLTFNIHPEIQALRKQSAADTNPTVISSAKVPNDILNGEITFRIPLPNSVNATVAYLTHGTTSLGLQPIQTVNGQKFIECTSASFSEWSVEPVVDVTSTDGVAAIGEATFATLQDAVARASSGDTIKLLTNVSEPNDIVITDGRKITIDVGAHNLVANVVPVTLKMGGGTYTDLRGTPMIGPKGSSFHFTTNDASFEILADETGITGINIYGGEVSQGESTGTELGHVLTLKSGTYTVPSGMALALRGPSFVDGGTLKTDGEIWLETSAMLKAPAGLKVVPCKCGLNGCNKNLDSNGNAINKVIYRNNAYVLVPVDVVAYIGDESFSSLEAALAAERTIKTIDLYADVTLTQNLTISKNITLNLRGHKLIGTLSVNPGFAARINTVNKNSAAYGMILDGGDSVTGSADGKLTVTAAKDTNSNYGSFQITKPDGANSIIARKIFLNGNAKFVTRPETTFDVTKADFSGEYMLDMDANGKISKGDVYSEFLNAAGNPMYAPSILQGSKVTIKVRNSAFMNTCTQIYVNSERVYNKAAATPTVNSTVKVYTGCTELELTADYVKNLPAGTHTVTFYHTIDGQDYTTESKFTVYTVYTAQADTTNPKTGDEIFVPMFVLFFSTAALAVLLMGKKKHF